MDGGYASYLRAVGASAGGVVAVEKSLPSRTVTEDLLESPQTLDFLRGLVDGRTYLMPMGISAAEEQLSEMVGLPLAGPGAEVCKRVNGKVYSRRLVDSFGLTPVPGVVCERVAELAGAVHAQLARGGRAVVKESLGVSGRGMAVVPDAGAADRLLRLIGRRGSQARADMVVESWIEDAVQLNYQFLVSRSGQVRFEAVKEAVLHDNVHQGHRFPVLLAEEHLAELQEAAQVIGRALHADGYYGVVGVDAMIGPDGTLYPCLEINARFNMSTYQSRIAERFIADGRHAVAATFNLKLSRAHSFGEVAAALGRHLFDGTNLPGVLVNNFATLNADVGSRPGPFHGRIYGICIAADAEEALALRHRTEGYLRALVKSGSS
jgi:carbamoylphosphate synthase large subunit